MAVKQPLRSLLGVKLPRDLREVLNTPTLRRPLFVAALPAGAMTDRRMHGQKRSVPGVATWLTRRWLGLRGRPRERLLDRLVASGCQPFRIADLFVDTSALESLGRMCEQAVPEAAMLGRSRRDLGQWYLQTANPTGTVRMDASELEGIPVIAADNVADYCLGLPASTQMGELVTSLAPPFRRCFVECAPSATDTK